MINIQPVLLMIILNVNDLSVSVKRQNLSEWIKKTQLYAVHKKIHLKCKDRLKVKGQRKIHQANGNQKGAGVAVLISDKAVFRPRKIIRNKRGNTE